jgi:hypothetical protein
MVKQKLIIFDYMLSIVYVMVFIFPVLLMVLAPCNWILQSWKCEVPLVLLAVDPLDLSTVPISIRIDTRTSKVPRSISGGVKWQDGLSAIRLKVETCNSAFHGLFYIASYLILYKQFGICFAFLFFSKSFLRVFVNVTLLFVVHSVVLRHVIQLLYFTA